MNWNVSPKIDKITPDSKPGQIRSHIFHRTNPFTIRGIHTFRPLHHSQLSLRSLQMIIEIEMQLKEVEWISADKVDEF